MFSSIAQAEDVFYPDLTCAQLLEMDSVAQEQAIDWLNGKAAGQDTLRLEELVKKPYSETIDACKTQPDEKVLNIIRHEY